MKDEAGFLPSDKYQRFLQTDINIRCLWPVIPRLFKITSLQYLKKEVSDEVDILHADKHESFLQIGIL